MNNFNGKLQEKDFYFCQIDNFEHDNNVAAYFLTHFHSDHMHGLKDLRIPEENNVYLYCSEITKRFIEGDPQIKIPSNKIKILEDEITDYVYHNNECIKVTALRAGHCPGSLMLLFESTSTRVLFTGDFRLYVSDLQLSETLHRKGKLITLDNIYLDTTFANPMYASFPKREQSFKIIKEIIKMNFLNDLIDYVIIQCPANIGLEYLMVELHKTFKKEIFVDPYFHDKFQSLIGPLEKCVTTDVSSTNIRFCPVKDSRCQVCPSLKTKFKDRVLLIKPSALIFRTSTTDYEYYIQEELFYRVVYSSHCSLDELYDFVNYLKPRKIFPLVVNEQEGFNQEMVIKMVLNWKDEK